MERATPRVMNPLWIISLFLSLCELTTSVAASQTHGWIQALLAIFSTVFPFAIASAFFAIVWRKPQVLYAPKDFPDHVTVGEYATAMSWPRQREALDSTFRVAAEKALQASESALPIEQRESAVDLAVQAARDDLERRTIVVDLKDAYDFPPAGNVDAQIVVSDTMSVGDFLDEVYYVLPKSWIPPYTYGDTWVLRDVESGTVLPNMGQRWAVAHGMGADSRALKEVGIRPGSRLEVQMLRRESHRGRP